MRAFIVSVLWVGLLIVSPNVFADAPARTTPTRATVGLQRGAFEVDSRELSGRGSKVIRVHNRFGSARVIGHDSDRIVVQWEKRAATPLMLRDMHVDVGVSTGQIDIRTRVVTARHSQEIQSNALERVDVVVRVPRTLRVDVEVRDGDIELRGMNRGARLAAYPGNIRVENVSGIVTAESSRGRQSFYDVVGLVTVRGLSSDVDIRTVRGNKLWTSLHDGSVKAVRLSSKNVEIRVTQGDIHVASGVLPPDARWRIVSITGNVRVDLSRANRAIALRARAMHSGRVQLDKRFQRVRVADGWQRVQTLMDGGRGQHADVAIATHRGAIQASLDVISFHGP